MTGIGWEELSTSALSTATAISALSAYAKHSSGDFESQGIIDRAVEWLVTNQNKDGGWGDTQKSYSNIATTLLAIAAFISAVGKTSFEPLLQMEINTLSSKAESLD